MRFEIRGPSGSAHAPWSSYAALRDNVQHHLEDGIPSDRFQALHALEVAVDRGHIEVSAARLRGEVLRAWYALGGLELRDGAISLRTRSIMTDCAVAPRARGTTSILHSRWEPPTRGSHGTALLDAACAFVVAVLRVTSTVQDGDHVVIRRDGRPPRFAKWSSSPPLVS